VVEHGRIHGLCAREVSLVGGGVDEPAEHGPAAISIASPSLAVAARVDDVVDVLDVLRSREGGRHEERSDPAESHDRRVGIVLVGVHHGDVAVASARLITEPGSRTSARADDGESEV